MSRTPPRQVRVARPDSSLLAGELIAQLDSAVEALLLGLDPGVIAQSLRVREARLAVLHPGSRVAQNLVLQDLIVQSPEAGHIEVRLRQGAVLVFCRLSVRSHDSSYDLGHGQGFSGPVRPRLYLFRGFRD